MKKERNEEASVPVGNFTLEEFVNSWENIFILSK